MRADRSIRVLISLALVLAMLAVLAAALFLTEKAFVVWEHLTEAPRLLFYTYVAAFAALALGSGWVMWRLLMPRRARAPAEAPELSEAGLHERLEQAEARGIDVQAARKELAALGARRDTGELYVALFGEVSSGKSSLVKALLPDEDVHISVRAGATRELREYTWESPAGDRLVIVDMPGLHEPGGGLDAQARDEAMRAHVVIYVCDGDLTRAQYAELESLLTFGKPTVVALNKSDRYDGEELAHVSARIRERVGSVEQASVEVVAVSAGGHEHVVRVDADGSETVLDRPRTPSVRELQEALQRSIDTAPGALDELRDGSVFVIAARRLDEAEAGYRRERAEEIVRKYTGRAVVGALAAVAPGTDLLIQGFLGTQMVRSLCELYGAPVRDIDVEQFLELSQKHVKRAVPLLLAVTGNALKAFPGVGTIAGGLMHSVAYGLIFDALGRSLAATLQAGGVLRPVPAARLFKEKLSEDLEARTRRLASLALEARREGGGD